MNSKYLTIINQINSLKTNFEKNDRNLKFFKFLFNNIRINLKNNIIEVRNIIIKYKENAYKMDALQDIFSHKKYRKDFKKSKSFYEYAG
jgi:GH15 family glucan-1,4-alpha-glucosidase